MSNSRTSKNCIHYLHKPEWGKLKNSDRFTGKCTLYPPEWVKRDLSEVSNREKELGRSSFLSLFRYTSETDYCGQHITKFGKCVERWYPVIYVSVGSILTTIGAYITHILLNRQQ